MSVELLERLYQAPSNPAIPPPAASPQTVREREVYRVNVGQPTSTGYPTTTPLTSYSHQYPSTAPPPAGPLPKNPSIYNPSVYDARTQQRLQYPGQPSSPPVYIPANAAPSARPNYGPRISGSSATPIQLDKYSPAISLRDLPNHGFTNPGPRYTVPSSSNAVRSAGVPTPRRSSSATSNPLPPSSRSSLPFVNDPTYDAAQALSKSHVVNNQIDRLIRSMGSVPWEETLIRRNHVARANELGRDIRRSQLPEWLQPYPINPPPDEDTAPTPGKLYRLTYGGGNLPGPQVSIRPGPFSLSITTQRINSQHTVDTLGLYEPGGSTAIANRNYSPEGGPHNEPALFWSIEPFTPEDPPPVPNGRPTEPPIGWSPENFAGINTFTPPQIRPQALPNAQPVPNINPVPSPQRLPSPAPIPVPQRMASPRPAPSPSSSPSPGSAPGSQTAPRDTPYPPISPTPTAPTAPSPSPQLDPPLNPPRQKPGNPEECCPDPMEQIAAIALVKVHPCEEEAGSQRVSVPNPMIQVVRFLAEQIVALGELICTITQAQTEKIDKILEYLETEETHQVDAIDCEGNQVEGFVVSGKRIEIIPSMIERLNHLNNVRENVLCFLPPPSGSEYVEISVPIAIYSPDGVVEISQTTIQVEANEQSQITNLFEQLASVKSYLNSVQRFSERTHNILGGNAWFGEDAASRTPSLSGKAEEQIKSDGVRMNLSGDTEQPVVVSNLVELCRVYNAVSYHRLGLNQLPAQVPQTLLAYTDKDKPLTLRSLSEYLGWFVQQMDGLIGQFPIEITIEDIDPLTKGNQTKKIELANISEALAEMYGQGVSTQLNSSVAINFLMRMASEVIATKNSSLITQDYVRANAAFLGYKGNPKRREINYSFNPTKLDTLDEFLQESKGYIVGWDEEDKESVVSFLQKIVFSAGIIKAVFMRNPKQLEILRKELTNMATGATGEDEKQWQAILDLINNPNSFFNRGDGPQPRVRDRDQQK